MTEQGQKGIPKHIVHSFQIHQENENISNNSDDDDNEHEIDIDYYERNFPIGSLFSFALQSSNTNVKDVNGAITNADVNANINPCSFHIGEGARLILKSAVLNPSHNDIKGRLSLFVSTNVNPDYVCICPNISNDRPVHDLSISVVGPALLQFALVHYRDGNDDDENDGHFESINLFGNVKLCDSDKQQLVSEAYQTFLQLEADADVNTAAADDNGDSNVDDSHDDDDKDMEYVVTETKPKDSTLNTNTSIKGSAKKKRKLSSANATQVQEKEINEPTPSSKTTSTSKSTASPSTKDTNESSPEPKKLTKKQRKKLAKEKEQQLQKVIAKENNHPTPSTESAESIASKRTRSLTRERMIAGGIRIQDILHGTGSTTRSGRKVSINYIGTFPDTDKVFDKNQSKSSPLTFRIGTGEVIRGLDRGMVGMKVGGERVITIPPKLGYGVKGSGGIPPNSILCFTVKLKSMGDKN